MASGNFLAIFTPLSNEPPASAFMTLDTRNSQPVLDADDATDEEAVFSGVIPDIYASGGFTVKVHVMATTATSGDVVIQAAFEALAAQDVDADGFAAFQTSGAVTVSGTSGIEVIATITFTDGAQADSVAAETAFRLKIRRDADNTSATDSVVGDCEISKVTIEET